MNKLVDVYVKTADKWELLYQDISEDIAVEIWRVGFKTGENKVSIERKADKEFWERQIEQIHKL